MSRLTAYLNERVYDRQIYKVKVRGGGEGEIWLGYAPGSGQTVPVSRKTYVTDKATDSNFDPTITKDFVTYAQKTKPMKANKDKTVRLYELPVYDSYDQRTFDIWGGEKKPVKKEYFTVALGEINVVTFFDSKNEALGWMKSTV
jgi:hypothetical protein